MIMGLKVTQFLIVSCSASYPSFPSYLLPDTQQAILPTLNLSELFNKVLLACPLVPSFGSAVLQFTLDSAQVIFVTFTSGNSSTHYFS
jgi:hypothetical protein